MGQAEETQTVTRQVQTTQPDIAQLETQADKGQAKAQYQLFLFYKNLDPILALRYLNQAVQQDYPLALNAMDWLYYKGDGITQDNQKAVAFLNKAKDKGEVFAYVNLATLYARGDAVAKDERKAAELLSYAADHGDSGGAFNLALAYAQGVGVQQDTDKAIFYLKKAAEGGLALAQQMYGDMLYKGEVVPQNIKQGLHLLTLSAEQGDVKAQTILGGLYGAENEYVEQNPELAFKWTERAAQHNDIDALANLGWMYDQAVGTQRDVQKGIQMLIHASEHGSAQSAMNLGMIYAKGEYVKKMQKKPLIIFPKLNKLEISVQIYFWAMPTIVVKV